MQVKFVLSSRRRNLRCQTYATLMIGEFTSHICSVNIMTIWLDKGCRQSSRSLLSCDIAASEGYLVV